MILAYFCAVNIFRYFPKREYLAMLLRLYIPDIRKDWHLRWEKLAPILDPREIATRPLRRCYIANPFRNRM